MKQPNFLCVGFAKCGTTTLHEILKQHPDIYLPAIKETEYYWSKDAYKKGFTWYLNRYYSDAKMEHAVGEVNPKLTTRHNAVKIAKDFSSDTKIIFFLRNPVDRMFSQYKFFLRYGYSFNNINLCIKYANRNREGFDRFIELNFVRSKIGTIVLAPTRMKNFIEISSYYNHIREYQAYFPKENLKYILFEDFIKNTEAVSQDLFRFLGVDPEVKIDYNIIANEGNLVPKNINSIYLYQMMLSLLDQLFKLNSNRFDDITIRLKEFLQRNIILAPETDKSKMSEEAKHLLEEYYLEDKQQIERLLDRDLSKIWF